MGDAEGSGFPVVRDEGLASLLKGELGYCACASGEAVRVLLEVLRRARERTDGTGDAAGFSAASRAVEGLLDRGGGWAEWVVFGLEQRGFVWHGFRLGDLWITEKGRGLLKGLEQEVGSRLDAG